MTKVFGLSFIVLGVFACKAPQIDTVYVPSTADTTINIIVPESGTFETSKKESENVPIPPQSLFKDHVYAPYIKSVKIYPQGSEVSQPLLTLIQDYKLILEFDDLDADRKNYRYTVTHCNADWTESNLMQSDYIEGFTENYISDYDYSFNTTTLYTHYQFTLPNDDIRFKLSGNYVVKVYTDNPNKPILTKRFFVLEQRVTVDATVKPSTILDDRQLKHEIDFKIRNNAFPIDNPYEGLHVSILQNHRWDNAITDLMPLFIKNDELEYNYEGVNSFWAGNEFRYFDSKSFRFKSDRILKFEYDSIQHVFLRPEPKRSFTNYSTEYDVNGRYAIRVQEGNEPSIEADYALTHFRLNYDAPILDGELYLFGELTNWEILPEARLTFSEDLKAFVGSMFLKQGYYNYEYVLVPREDIIVDNTYIEGTHYQTENEYTIYIYNRNNTEIYDRLIGMKQLNSGNIF